MERIHLIVDRTEKERFRRRAEREGKSLSAWLRDAAREKLEAGEAAVALDSEDALAAFFADCDAREQGREPEWSEHLRVMEESRRSGQAAS